MKTNQLLALCGIATALFLSTGTVSAQNNNGGAGRRGGFRNFDPAQFQQRIMDNIRQDLGFTNDTDWNAVQPLVQKVMDARRDLGGPGMRMMFRSPRGSDQNRSRRGGFFGQPRSEATALQNAIDNNAPTAQIKDLLAKYRAAQKAKQAKLEEAQANLRKVLTVKQEAQATLLGWLQ